MADVTLVEVVLSAPAYLRGLWFLGGCGLIAAVWLIREVAK